MKVLISGINYSPELTGIGKYTGEMAEWLSEQGHEVRVVAAPPYYPEWKVRDGYSALRYRHEEMNGIDVWRCPVFVPSHPTGFKRIVHLLSIAVSSLPVMLCQAFWRPDVVVAIEPPLFCAPGAWLTARFSGAKCWLHVQDFEVDAAFALRILNIPTARRLVLSIESWLLRRFDRVSSISVSMVDRLHQKGVARERCFLFRNWADIEKVIYDAAAADDFRRQQVIPVDTFVALYSGNMGEKQGLELVLEAAERLQHENILFVLCGDGAARERLLQRACNMENVRFLDLQPNHLLAGMLSAVNVHLVIQKAGAADLVMPSKLSNILAVGGVSIVTAEENSELGRLFSEYPYMGLLCPPGNVDELVECVKYFQLSHRVPCHPKVRSYAEQHIGKTMILSRCEREMLSIQSRATGYK
ncbi:MAG: glycosyl transferase [Zetaproteobacteria bacterium CG2_30_59_37]|nr:MAG: glycosyl transferase [Zetaproteobacteria bacterium CG2_30_59_37]